MIYLLDTNVISEVLAKQPNPDVLAWLESQPPEAIRLSVVTLGELQKGVVRLEEGERKRRLQGWLHQELLEEFEGRLLVIDAEVCLIWGEMVGRCSKEGRVLAALDSLLAASALRYGCTLVTRNERDFVGTGVLLFNPWRLRG